MFIFILIIIILNVVDKMHGNVGGMSVGHHWAVQDIFMSYGVGVHHFGGGAIRQVAPHGRYHCVTAKSIISLRRGWSCDEEDSER